MTRFPFGPDAIRMLADILVEKGLAEIELSEKDSRIRIVQAAPNGVRHGGAPAAQAHSESSSFPQRSAPASVNPAAAAPAGAVLSPMVGIAYLSPEPDAPPFVTVGQHVEAGQTLLLIEAMKSFSPVTAPTGGVVKRLLIENGQMAEYGQPLVIVE